MTQKSINEIGLKQFLKSRATGMFIGTIIGLFWMLYAATLATLPLNIIITALSLIAAVYLIFKIKIVRKNQKVFDEPNFEEKNRNRKRKIYFLVNFIIEIILLNICFYYLTKYNLNAILIFSIAIIVGLHFIPMAIFLKTKQFYICSAIMIVSGVFFISISNSLENLNFQILQSLVCGIALWLTVGLSIRDTFVNEFYTKQK